MQDKLPFPKRSETTSCLWVAAMWNSLLMEQGQVRLVPINISVESLAEVWHRPKMKPVSLEEIEIAISEGVDDWA